MKGQTSTRTKVLHALMIVVLTILLLLFIAYIVKRDLPLNQIPVLNRFIRK